MSSTADTLDIKSSLALPNTSHRIPRLGFGVYLSPAEVCERSCLTALKAGYKHIDSAQYYANETEVGHAVVASKIARSEVFLTTKILSAGSDAQATYRKVIESVEKLSPGKDGYADLFLIHSPHGGAGARKLMWQALERAYNEGRCKAIGVSNFSRGNIEEMKSYAKVWPPMVNQIELHPFCQQRHVVSYCSSLSPPIVISAYSPIVRNQKASNSVVSALATAYNKAPNQILIRYSLQKGWVPLPKSDTPSRIEENAGVFGWELSADNMKQLDDLDQGSKGSIVEAVADD